MDEMRNNGNVYAGEDDVRGYFTPVPIPFPNPDAPGTLTSLIGLSNRRLGTLDRLLPPSSPDPLLSPGLFGPR